MRAQQALIFFDPRARANSISLELEGKLRTKTEEMSTLHEVGLACPCHLAPVTPIIGKIRQSYIDSEVFFIMPLKGSWRVVDVAHLINNEHQ